MISSSPNTNVSTIPQRLTSSPFSSPTRAAQTISKGSSLKFLMVAEGSAHIYPRMGPTCEWDTCAAQAIVECGGGKVRFYKYFL